MLIVILLLGVLVLLLLAALVYVYRALGKTKTALIEVDRKMAENATIDLLTGLPSHRTFMDNLAVEHARCRRYGHPLAVLLVDIDLLKKINDENGHSAGDAVLRGIGHLIALNLRTTDMGGRTGGGEFAVLLRETDALGTRVAAEKIRVAVETEKFATDKSGFLTATVSVGGVAFTKETLAWMSRAEEILKQADAALRRAKNEGRNRVVIE